MNLNTQNEVMQKVTYSNERNTVHVYIYLYGLISSMLCMASVVFYFYAHTYLCKLKLLRQINQHFFSEHFFSQFSTLPLENWRFFFLSGTHIFKIIRVLFEITMKVTLWNYSIIYCVLDNSCNDLIWLKLCSN